MEERGIRRVYDLTGVVQGVGFRPAVYRLARAAGLGGSVQNRAGTVRLALEGPRAAVDAFMQGLPAALPALARLDQVTLLAEEALDAAAAPAPFVIEASGGDEAMAVTIPADLAMCSDCRREVLDPADRRYGYPFTTCTRCGPRYTVVTAMPYDRERTTLAAFPLCPACRREYEDPADRRFHAESTACPVCGPRLTLKTAAGVPVAGAPLRAVRAALAAGRIVAVRGVGGFLLAADAFNRAALQTLRARKQRPAKPFAVMAPDLAAVRRYCEVPAAAAELLTAPAAPIVILDVRADALAEGRLPLDLISPDTRTLGVMLPTSPLHLLLAEPLAGDTGPRFELLIMTSGNHRGEPICIRNPEAAARLGDIADLILEHDREINLRNDDSVAAIQAGAPQVWRRARGFAPEAVRLPRPLWRCVLAMGADMKNTIAVGYGDRVVLAPHIGDLDTPEALAGLEQVMRTLPGFLQQTPAAVAVDLHPDMESSRAGRRLAREAGLPVVAVQHHHAHAAACLAEHGVEQALVLVMDGTGLGTDGHIWGAELLEVTPGGYRRWASFDGVPLPGGDAAVRRPARQLVARWVAAGLAVSAAWRTRLGVTEEELEAWVAQARRGLNAPITHAAGRVFDACAAALGVAPAVITYEGQPAIRLEAAARQAAASPGADALPFARREQDGVLWIDWAPAFLRLADRDLAGGQAAEWALAVHEAIARAAEVMIDYALAQGAPPVVGLSGGCFMNRILSDRLGAALAKRRVRALVHRQTPPGDGCVALGQAVVAGGDQSTE